MNEVSGGYRFDALDKKVTFELRLNTSRSKEGYSSPIQKILLGFSEDEIWGNDFIISCDTHRHMSAFGQWKVLIFHDLGFSLKIRKFFITLNYPNFLDYIEK